MELDSLDEEKRMTMQFLMNLSDGMDLNALQKCFPTLDGARSNRLRIDGIPSRRARTGRDYAILLNPEGYSFGES